MKMIGSCVFPETPVEAKEWQPVIIVRPLARCVLAVAKTRVEGTWSAYCDAVAGQDHDYEKAAVLRTGCKLLKEHAKAIFPELADIPYSK